MNPPELDLDRKCGICGTVSQEVFYHGPIRMGKFGDLSREPHPVLRCPSCGSRYLPDTWGDKERYYQSQEYRQSVDEGAGVHDFFRLHDPEQSQHLAVTGTGRFRGKVVADVGCGGGSFLDCIRGLAARAIAIEPSALFRESLVGRGYSAYPYVQDALKEFRGGVDQLVSFDVLEHVEDPVDFLKGIRSLLAAGGSAHIGTPNADDFLLEALPDAYPAFFYRKAHLWYFNAQALSQLCSRAGFSKSRIIPVQRYGLGNCHGWLREKRPLGHVSPFYLTTGMEAMWKDQLEKTLRCDYLYVEAFR